MGGIWWTSSPCRQRTGRLCGVSREEFAPNVSASLEGGSVGRSLTFGRSQPLIQLSEKRSDDPFEAVSDDLRVVTSNLKQNDFFFL
jgi:hypothetical protein